MYKSEQYSYKVFWSDNDEGYRATVLEFPGLSNIADTQDEALHGIVDLVGTVLEEIEKHGIDFEEAKALWKDTKNMPMFSN